MLHLNIFILVILSIEILNLKTSYFKKMDMLELLILEWREKRSNKIHKKRVEHQAICLQKSFVGWTTHSKPIFLLLESLFTSLFLVLGPMSGIQENKFAKKY